MLIFILINIDKYWNIVFFTQNASKDMKKNIQRLMKMQKHVQVLIIVDRFQTTRASVIMANIRTFMVDLTEIDAQIQLLRSDWLVTLSDKFIHTHLQLTNYGVNSYYTCQVDIINIQSNFFTGTRPKKSKYGKHRFGQVMCIQSVLNTHNLT